MPAPESVRRAYDRAAPLVASVAEYVRSTLQPYCGSRAYLFKDRVKDLESVSEKIEGGRTDRWSMIDDLYACTVVVPSPTHEAAVLESLSKFFTVRTVRSRNSAAKAPDVFRFDTTRFYGSMGAAAAAQRLPGLDQIIFEVQIPTVFEYAWSTVTHDLVYKSDAVDWQRHRLAAQLKALVEQAEMVIETFETASAALYRSSWPEIDAKARIVDRFKGIIASGAVMSHLAPRSWNRFADNVYALIESYTSNRYKMSSAVETFLEGVSNWIQTSGIPAASGSLFQLVIGYVSANDSEGSIDRFRVVPSEELANIHGVVNVAKKFEFDG
jgi:hypothetical protein